MCWEICKYVARHILRAYVRACVRARIKATRYRRTCACQYDAHSTNIYTPLSLPLIVKDCQTCTELKKAGLVETSDAQLSVHTNSFIWVHCNMDDENGVGITVIGGSRDTTAI